MATPRNDKEAAILKDFMENPLRKTLDMAKSGDAEVTKDLLIDAGEQLCLGRMLRPELAQFVGSRLRLLRDGPADEALGIRRKRGAPKKEEHADILIAACYYYLFRVSLSHSRKSERTRRAIYARVVARSFGYSPDYVRKAAKTRNGMDDFSSEHLKVIIGNTIKQLIKTARQEFNINIRNPDF